MTDPAREAQWLRHLLVQVAHELDRLAIERHTPADVLTERAMRIRRRLHDGPPDGWLPPQQPASEPL